MKEIFRHYAKCNQLINKEVIRVLEGARMDAYGQAVDGYFKSIGEILDHIFKADLVWINSIKSIGNYKVFADPFFEIQRDPAARFFTSLAAFKEERIRLDAIISELIEEIDESDLTKTLSRINKKGERQDRILWKALVHIFNHETHHRGQVSQILDQLKIENDYSNMIRIE
jgi:uncharacterized damage-inducible protein DinB